MSNENERPLTELEERVLQFVKDHPRGVVDEEIFEVIGYTREVAAATLYLIATHRVRYDPFTTYITFPM